jgi:hypothetical protein
MGLLVAILIIALIAAAAYIVMQRRPGGVGGVGRPANSPLPRRGRISARRDPMAAAVADHAQATDPQDAMAAEQRLRAQARQVAAGLQSDALRSEHQRASAQADAYDGVAPVNGAPAGYADPRYTSAGDAAYPDPRGDERIDPATGARTDGYGDPANDPRYNDPRYEGRLAADYVPPEERPR